MSFNSKLTGLLKTDPRFVDDEGELIIAAVQDRAWKIDRDLVKLLLSDAEIKVKFFEEIDGHWIFNLNTFIDYISQKNFLDNSYTRFRNRIGLTIGDKYLRERGDVALVWPYKDTVLEGGQTNEEEKRKEIFFNEVLAQDEINRLLGPKVLTNFVRYTAKGKEKVTGFKRDENGVISENLIIKGNNLLALHTLKTQFRGQVKFVPNPRNWTALKATLRRIIFNERGSDGQAQKVLARVQIQSRRRITSRSEDSSSSLSREQRGGRIGLALATGISPTRSRDLFNRAYALR